jgi:hypothetical protein
MSKDMADAIAGSVRGATVLLGEGFGPTTEDDTWSGGSVEDLWREFSGQGGDGGAPSRYGDSDEFWVGGQVGQR